MNNFIKLKSPFPFHPTPNMSGIAERREGDNLGVDLEN